MGKHQISDRAHAFLTTLRRRPSVSVETVIAKFSQFGIRLPDSLIQFHVDFGGYVIPLGFEEAILGLVHDEARFLGENGFDFEVENGELFVACADAHPSYDFWLSSNGSLAGLGNGGPYVSFEEYVENLAAGYPDVPTNS